MNGLALGGFLQGQRLADEDWRTEQRFPLTQEQLMLANQGAGLQNNRYAQETPLHLTGMQQQNEARGMQNARYAQETPLHIAGMGLQNTGRELQNSGQTLQNSRYQQMTPLEVQQQQIGNYGNYQLNQKRGIDLATTQQLQPTQNALALQQGTQALAAGGINQGIQAYRTTGNIGALKQAIDGAHGGNVQIAPLPDGSVQVTDTDGSHKFGSMDEFLGVVGQAAAPAATGKATTNPLAVGGAPRTEFTKQWDKSRAKDDAEYAEGMRKASQNNAVMTRNLDELSALSDKINEGKVGAFKSYVGSFMPSLKLDPTIDDKQSFEAIVNGIIPTLRVPGSGVFTDKDAEMMAKTLPSLSGTLDGRKQVLETLKDKIAMSDAEARSMERYLAAHGTLDAAYYQARNNFYANWGK